MAPSQAGSSTAKPCLVPGPVHWASRLWPSQAPCGSWPLTWAVTSQDPAAGCKALLRRGTPERALGMPQAQPPHGPLWRRQWQRPATALPCSSAQRASLHLLRHFLFGPFWRVKT